MSRRERTRKILRNDLKMRNPPIGESIRLALMAGCLVLPAYAAGEDQSTAPATDSAPAAEASPPISPDYLLPDLPAGSLVHEGRGLTIKPIIAIVVDYTAFEQDESSLEQVGKQDDALDLRAIRLGAFVRSKGKLGWTFTFTTDYQEKRTRDDQVWQMYDVKFDIPISPMKLTVGKQKEAFVFDMVGLMPQLPTQERILSPFFVTRNIGLQFSGPLAGERMTWAAGIFNDSLETEHSLRTTATDYTIRVTGLPSVSSDNRNYLHLGLGLRQAGSDDGSMRFSGRPGSNVADKYLDTGSFIADSATMLSLEAVWSQAPFMLLAEHIEGWVDAPESGDPHFAGSYLTASWVVTGESRPYLRNKGYAGGIVPSGRFGAVELAVRYGHVDLADGLVDGGILSHWSFGVNWWTSAQWKVGLSYGNADLDRFNLNGNTKMLLLRTQWMY